MPLVSYVMPTYNQAGLLREAIDSCLAQTHQDIEVVVCDDASTDETPEVLAEYVADPRVRVVTHIENGGQYRATWDALSAARGEWASWMNSDDKVEPDHAASLLAEADKGYEVVLCHYDIFETGHKTRTHSAEPKWNPHAPCQFTLLGMLIRRGLWWDMGGLDDRFQRDADSAFLWTLAHGGFKVGYVPRVLAHYRNDHPESNRVRMGHISPSEEEYELITRFSVSVVMPVYNQDRYVAEAIESVLAQTMDRFCLIIVNDGSTDGSAEIIEKYRAQDQRIRVLAQQANCGLEYSANRGMLAARGNYCVYFHADDKLHPAHLERMLHTIGDADVGLCGYDQIINPHSGDTVAAFMPKTWRPETLKSAQGYSILGMMLKNGVWKALGGLNLLYKWQSDWDFLLRLAKSGRLVAVTSEPLAVYRNQHEQSARVRYWGVHSEIEEMKQLKTEHALT